MIILIPPSEGKKDGGSGKPITFDNHTKEILKSVDISLSKETMAAIERYTGVVYKGIDYPTLTNKKRFDRDVRIISGLFGAVKPRQLIPNYKLKMSKTYKYWRNHLHFDKVIDLLPQEHRKAVTHNGIRIEFFKMKNGKKVSAGHMGKLIKGKFIRWLIEKNYPPFEEFTEEGYQWNGTVYVKPL